MTESTPASQWIGQSLGICLDGDFVTWAVLSDEQMSHEWPFSLLNDEQMSNKVGVEHQPVTDSKAMGYTPWN